MKLFKRREPRIDTDAIVLQAEQSIKTVEDQQEKVNALNTWLINRHQRNGFGEDIEITFRPKEA